MTRSSRVHLVLAFSAAAALAPLTAPIHARQAEPSQGATTPAEKAGWWVRLNAANQARRVYWRFGSAPHQLSAPMTWVQGTSPEALDAPVDQRMLARIHLASIGMPPDAAVSFCVFFADRGVALVEFTQETNLDIDQTQSAEQCVP
jgi:hypothetical protein